VVADFFDDSGRRRQAMANRPARITSSTLIVLAFVAMTLGPVAVIEFPHEMARWQVAIANEDYLNGKLQPAIDRMDRAIRWDADDATLYYTRAKFRFDARQWHEGLDDCDAAMRLANDAYWVIELRCQFLQHVDAFPEAIAQWQKLFKIRPPVSTGERVHLLNGLAYMRAVGNLELGEAVRDIEEGLKLAGGQAAILDPAGMLYLGRGQSESKNGDDEKAVASFSRAWELADDVFQQNKKRLEATRAAPASAIEYADRLRLLTPHLAAVLTQRAAAYDRLGRADAAKKDRQRIEQLSENGNLSIATPLQLGQVLDQINLISNLLDTRGFLQYRQGNLAAARRDMQRAAEMIDWVRKAFPWRLEVEPFQIMDLRLEKLRQRTVSEASAVIHYHSSLVHRAAKRNEKADEELDAVRRLGFEPDDHLF